MIRQKVFSNSLSNHIYIDNDTLLTRVESLPDGLWLNEKNKMVVVERVIHEIET